MDGYIMQLQNFSVNDGEGIRTTIFLAGCPLHCAWCSNPEGQTEKNPLTRLVSSEEVLREIRHQLVFYRQSGGGVTFSGGEATAQPDFLRELTDALYDDGISLALETCGFFSFERIEPILKKMDLIFMDLKHIDPDSHRAFTGVDNGLILENMVRAYRLGLPLVVRIPAILGVNCDDEARARTFSFLQENCPGVRLEFLPYHRYGEAKYLTLGKELPSPSFGTPSPAQLRTWEQCAQQYGLQVVSYR